MKKDIEWLKGAIQQNLDFYNDNDEEWQMAKVRAYAKSLDLINQLDEPEVLSQELIYEKAIDTHVDTANGEIQVTFILDDLQNLLVPRQELPVIPQFVAEWIEASRYAAYHLLGAVYDGAYSEDVKEWLFKGDKRTRQDNQDKLTRAWLFGYTVKKEKKYQVKDKNVFMLFKLDGKVVPTAEHFIVSATRNIENDLTEQEIKDYDERYFAFAVPVEELEE